MTAHDLKDVPNTSALMDEVVRLPATRASSVALERLIDHFQNITFSKDHRAVFWANMGALLRLLPAQEINWSNLLQLIDLASPTPKDIADTLNDIIFAPTAGSEGADIGTRFLTLSRAGGRIDVDVLRNVGADIEAGLFADILISQGYLQILSAHFRAAELGGLLSWDDITMRLGDVFDSSPETMATFVSNLATGMPPEKSRKLFEYVAQRFDVGLERPPSVRIQATPGPSADAVAFFKKARTSDDLQKALSSLN